MEAATNTLVELEQHTGLKVSFEKSQIHRIGELKGKNVVTELKHNLTWTDSDLDVLGVKVMNDRVQSNVGLEEVIEKMKDTLSIWKHRSLTLMGKVQIINTLAASLFVHKMLVVPLINDNQIGEINKIMEGFLWGTSTPKIPLRVLQLPKDRGGLNLVNFKIKHKALLAQWALKIVDDTIMNVYVYEWLVPELKSFIWECNLNSTDAVAICKQHTFWTDVLSAWCDFNHGDPIEKDLDPGLQILWYNSFIRVGGEVLRPFKDAIASGILRIKDLMKDGRVMTHREISDIVEIPWLSYQQMIHAIPQRWIKACQCETISLGENDWLDLDLEEPQVDKLSYVHLLDISRPSKVIYRELILHSSGVGKMKDYWQRWNSSFGDTLTYEEYLYMFRKLYKTTSITKFRNFQYRLLLNKIFTNMLLSKWGIVKSDKCEFCKNCVQTVVHLLAECESIRPVWDKAFKIIGGAISTLDILKNNAARNNKAIENCVVLITKYFIFSCKCKGETPTVQGLRHELMTWRNVIVDNAQIDKLDKYVEQWKLLDI